MNGLITITNKEGRLLVSSREVARNFGKEHRGILRDLDNLKEGVAQNWADLFYETNYTHEQNKQEYREVLMNRDGFTLLAMGFTGQKALQWKLKYIEAFNKMENALREQRQLSNLSPQLQLLINMELEQKQLKAKTEILEHRINNLDKTNINGTSRQRLNSMIRKFAYANGIIYSEAWRRFRSSFNMAYSTNIELRKSNYQEKNSIKELSYPDFLERTGLIEDSLRVADKMLNE